MNYTKTKADIEADLFIQQMKVSRIPSNMGSFSSLLSKNLGWIYEDVIIDHINDEGLNTSEQIHQQRGFNSGLDKGLKGFIINGENQLFVNKVDNSVYTFHTNSQILNSDKVGKLVKEFAIGENNKIIKEIVDEDDSQIFINKYVNELSKNPKWSNSTLSDIDKVRDNLNERKSVIITEYEKLTGIKETEISNINSENDNVIEKLNNVIEKLTPSKRKKNTLQLNKDILKLKLKQSEILSRTNIQTLIDSYIIDNQSYNHAYNFNSSINGERDSFRKNKTRQAELFTDIKNRSTAMMLTDKFDIYNVNEIRKFYPEKYKLNNEVNDIFTTIKEREILSTGSTDLLKTIADFRTIKGDITLENFADQIRIPLKHKTIPDLNAESINVKFKENVPNDSNKMIVTIRRPKK